MDPVVIDETGLKSIADGVFSFAETTLERNQPMLAAMVVPALKLANSTIDTYGIPALMEFLRSRGIVA